MSNDLAVWELSEPPYYGNNTQIHPIPMTTVAVMAGGSKAKVLGWGRTRNRAYSDRLKELGVPIWKREDCEREYGGADFVHAGMQCAGGEPDKDTCQGGECFG